ncbi:type ISP restriction/modification enzyme [Geminocystis herdmanii]|uniref:type ISP restriction/modification enzyme n=1 Tax=Geminocystis herdmanii TaxID=669359 RepID=UPI00034A927A|nr:type ISP restriction/modification enzyme [Geminocystis herdmanii]
MFKQYLESIAKTCLHGDQREESFYPAIANLITDFANSLQKKKVSVTILPKKTEAGNPDFRVWDGDHEIIGYIEAKIPNTDLDKTQNSEQLKRYLSTFPNVILTNFYEFRLYRQGELIKQVSIGRYFVTDKLKTIPPLENQADFEQLLTRFFDFSLPKIFTAEILAIELAKRTRFLRDEIITNELKNEDKKNYIKGFYQAFQQYLIAGLAENEFADLYAQTITYDLFTAKTRAKEDEIFSRKNAIENIPPTIGILRDIFEYISLGKLSIQMETIIDDIAEVLRVADASKILQEFYQKGRGEDPIIHFYETFLNQYDPTTREKRGVYYTPSAVVKYIVNSVEEILKKDFDKIGFADHTVKVLDPAGGTLTFLAEAVKKALTTFVEYFGNGNQKSFIKGHILQNFYGFELMMSPYAIAHLKMSYLLQEYGYNFEDVDRFQLYLTNTLDAKMVEIPQLPGLSSLAEEATEANLIKKETPVLAIIGNPPYSIASYNKSEFETEIMKLYKEDVKDEKNIQILSDDYIKFIRYCHWKIEQSGSGVVSLITKNTYLNIAAAKGLRKQLLLTFDEIYILNLHGKLYEKTPEGEKDDNVFDIRVGTAIIFLVKKEAKKKTTYGKLFCRDLYGNRALKYDYLNSNNILTSFSQEDEIRIDEKHFFFERKNFTNADLYNSFWAIDQIFEKNTSGIKTHRDSFIIADKKEILISRLRNFINFDQGLIKETYNLDNSESFNIEKIKAKFQTIDEQLFYPYFHKPFYYRQIYYESLFIDRDRKAVMMNFINDDNLGFVIKKRHTDNIYNHCFITNSLTDINFLGGQSYVFPLWINRSEAEINQEMYDKRKRISNLNPQFEQLLEKTYQRENITEEIFYYIYGILYSNIYRDSFAESLKIDYPKIPFTEDVDLFFNMAKLGKELANLHLLKSSKLSKPLVKFKGEGEGKIEKIKYDSKKQVIYINKTQYFDNISDKLWNFEIGKNRVIQQYLKRKTTLEFADAIEFSRIATAIYETFSLQDDIDKIYPEILTALLTNI